MLVFRDSLGAVNGHSYTWEKGEKPTKEVVASIVGRVDKKNKSLSFREDKITSNKGFESNVTICLVQAVLILVAQTLARAEVAIEAEHEPGELQRAAASRQLEEVLAGSRLPAGGAATPRPSVACEIDVVAPPDALNSAAT